MMLIYDATAYMVWPYMGYSEYMEIYSGYDHAWKLAHCPDYWINELTLEGIIPTIKELYNGYDEDMWFVPEAEIDVYLRYIVPKVMEKYNMYAAAKIEISDSTKDENGKKHVPIKVHFIGVGILEIPDTQTIIAAKEEICKNPSNAA